MEHYKYLTKMNQNQVLSFLQMKITDLILIQNLNVFNLLIYKIKIQKYF